MTILILLGATILSGLFAWLISPLIIRNEVEFYEKQFPCLPNDHRTYLDLLLFKPWPGKEA